MSRMAFIVNSPKHLRIRLVGEFTPTDLRVDGRPRTSTDRAAYEPTGGPPYILGRMWLPGGRHVVSFVLS